MGAVDHALRHDELIAQIAASDNSKVFVARAFLQRGHELSSPPTCNLRTRQQSTLSVKRSTTQDIKPTTRAKRNRKVRRKDRSVCIEAAPRGRRVNISRTPNEDRLRGSDEFDVVIELIEEVAAIIEGRGHQRVPQKRDSALGWCKAEPDRKHRSPCRQCFNARQSLT